MVKNCIYRLPSKVQGTGNENSMKLALGIVAIYAVSVITGIAVYITLTEAYDLYDKYRVKKVIS